MPQGTIKTLVTDRGFGFIRPESKSDPDVFFHLSALVDVAFEELKAGTKVRFELAEGRNGKPRAENIEVL
jgi:CspA family cold shock protein